MTVHPVIRLVTSKNDGDEGNTEKEEKAHKALLKAVNAFTPSKIAFEISDRGKTIGAALMRDRRKALTNVWERAVVPTSIVKPEPEIEAAPLADEDMADEDDIEVRAKFSLHNCAC